jgi:hypothetical protein
MTRRLVDSSMWQNEKFATLPAMARLLQIGMINHADDQGRGKAHPSLLRAQVFPYDDVTLGDVAEWLRLIQNNGTIKLYAVDGKDYYQMCNWWEYQAHQYAMPSDYPKPDGWNDRIRKTFTKGQIVTCNWILSNGTRSPDTCDEQGRPIQVNNQVNIQDKDKDKDKEYGGGPPPAPPLPTPSSYFGMPVGKRSEKVIADSFVQEAAKFGVDAPAFVAICNVLIDTAGWRELIEKANDSAKLRFAKEDAVKLASLGIKSAEKASFLVEAYKATHSKKFPQPRDISEYASQVNTERQKSATGGTVSNFDYSALIGG